MRFLRRPARRVPTPAQSPLAVPLLIAVGFFLAGRAPAAGVKADRETKPKVEIVARYSIHNRNPLIEDDSLRYKEAVGVIKVALSGKGLEETPDERRADIIVDLDYGVRPPQEKRETISEPIYMSVPGPVETQTVQIGTDSKGRPVTQTTSYRGAPRVTMVGLQDRTVTLIVYEKYLHLSASENKPVAEGNQPVQIWAIDAISVGESHDIRKNLPIIVAASIDVIGQDAHGQKSIRIKDREPDVAVTK